jgi:hypothetical protein
MAQVAMGVALDTTSASVLSTVPASCLGTNVLAVAYAEPAMLVAVVAYALTKPMRLRSPVIFVVGCVGVCLREKGSKREVQRLSTTLSLCWWVCLSSRSWFGREAWVGVSLLLLCCCVEGRGRGGFVRGGAALPTGGAASTARPEASTFPEGRAKRRMGMAFGGGVTKHTHK